jgi:hypothetical protein
MTLKRKPSALDPLVETSASQARGKARHRDVAGTSNFDGAGPAAGNQAMQRMLSTGAIRAKLAVSQAGDPEEQEADRIADQVMAGMAVAHGKCDACAAGGTCPKCNENETVQAKRKPGASQQGSVTDLKTVRGGGEPLSAPVRGFFERGFGTDFSDVRVHTGKDAANSAQSIQARAYTVSQDVVFGAGEYAPHSSEGQRLLAHELAHVVQQHGSETAIQRQPVAGTTASPAASSQPAQANAVTTPQAATTPTRGLNPPVYWGHYTPRSTPVVITRWGVTLENIAEFLYGTVMAAVDLASLNELEVSVPLNAGVVVYPTGEPLTAAAAQSLGSARLLPAGCGDPDFFIAQRAAFDALVLADFNTIVGMIDKALPFAHFNVPLPGAAAIFRKWGEERFTEYPWAYSNGSDYLDRLFHKLYNKTKILSGVFVDEWTNYYSLLFNHFDRDDEIAGIRDRNSVVYRGEKAIEEISFAKIFWEDLKSGRIRDRIFAFGRGLAKGAWSGLKGAAKFAYTLATDPGQAWEDLKKVPGALATLWKNRSALWDKFANASPEEQAEMIGQLFGEIEFALASAGVGSAAGTAVKSLGELPGIVGKTARVVDAAISLPGKVLGGAANITKTILMEGVGLVAEGAAWAARGLFKFGSNILRGTWSVVEETVGAVTRRFYYFYDEAAGVLRKIEEKIASLFVKCNSPCKLDKQARLDLIAERAEARKAPNITSAESILKGPGMGFSMSDEAEGILVTASGETMAQPDPMIRMLLALKGTAMHQRVYQLLEKIWHRLVPNSVFTEKNWRELEKVLGVKVPKRGNGLDIVVLDHTKSPKVLRGLDITHQAGDPAHVQKALDDLAGLRAALEGKGWTVVDDVLEPAWKGKTAQTVTDELVDILNKLAGGE